MLVGAQRSCSVSSLLLDAGDQLVAYLAQQAPQAPARRRPHQAGPAAPRTASPLRLVRRTTA